VAQLPPSKCRSFSKRTVLPLTAHSRPRSRSFAGIIRYETIGNVLERSRLADVRVLKLIDSLLRKGVFSVVKSETTMEETFVSRPRQDLILEIAESAGHRLDRWRRGRSTFPPRACRLSTMVMQFSTGQTRHRG
jgi:hypothetical protein